MICTKCKKDLPLTSFGKRAERAKGTRSACKECLKVQRKTRDRTKEGVLKAIYDREMRATERNISVPDYSLMEFTDWAMAQPVFHSLHEAWANAGYPKELKPSADRKDDYVGYTLENLQWMTFRENHLKGSSNVAEGINRKALVPITQWTKEGDYVREYYSVAEANRELGKPKHSSCIVSCLRGRQNSAFGYLWRYK